MAPTLESLNGPIAFQQNDKVDYLRWEEDEQRERDQKIKIKNKKQWIIKIKKLLSPKANASGTGTVLFFFSFHPSLEHPIAHFSLFTVKKKSSFPFIFY